MGTSLIGGCLALGIKKENDVTITVYDIFKAQVERAKELSVVDEIGVDSQSACEEAHLIVFASPVEETKKLLHKLASFSLREDVI
ncbi:prephenate dehydrogenase/arogenate dehydrogenase family protein, partial [Bacillus thuringiensis]|uniref:prephenate dehydrogenase/arogenate dehydrogenase family protein n=1 Tax=Bacillus thuringiensis TaxID=1428 RepID=UPI0028528D33